MFVSQWLNQSGKPISPAEFHQWLLDTALSMYQKGWTVIGSYCKTPNLHPWKAIDRDQLLQWALEDLHSLRANSLNLRLKDSNVIALDCDFHDPSLMAVFVSELSSLLGLHSRNFYTCKGLKGGKIFFRYSKQTLKDKPPRSLGPVAYSKGFEGSDNAKQELEIKSDLSTFAGLYGSVTSTNINGQSQNDYIVYAPVEGCSYIADVSPNELQAISLRTLHAIEDLYKSLLYKGGFVDKAGAALEPISYRATLIAAVASYIVRLMLKRGNHFDVNALIADAAKDPTFESKIVPYYRYLHLDEASNMIRRMFRSGPPVKADQEAIILGMVEALHSRNIRYFIDLGGPFIPLTRRFNERLKQDAQQLGYITESMTMQPEDLCILLATHKGAM